MTKEDNKNNQTSIYEDIGGEDILRQLVKEFYNLMDTEPEFEIIRKMHDNLQGSEDKLFTFLSGWMGGPPLYMNKYGHPRLRARHMPFPITHIERDQWLKCMYDAMTKLKINNQLKLELMKSFHQIADFMRNKQ